MGSMHHYLLVYGYDEGRLVQQDEFTDADQATAAYAEAERTYRDHPRYEIVLVSSDSIETIMKTHGHYFPGDTSSLFSEFLRSA